MTISARSALMAGLATVTASAVLVAPSVQPLPPPKPTIQLAASSVTAQPLALPAEYSAQLAEWWQELFLPSADRSFPAPPTQPLPTPGSVPSSLEATYHAIEPWVQYGFEVAQYALGWVPYVGWLSGQVMIFYFLGEGIVHAIVHNTLDWLDGNGSFAQNLGEGIRWSIDTLIQFGINEWNYFLPPLPPLPPIPCIVFCANLAEFNAPLDGVRVGLLETVTDLLTGLSDRIPLPRDPEEPPVGLTTEDVPGSHGEEPRPCVGSQPRAGNGDRLLEPLCRGRGRECRHSSGITDRTEEATTSSHVARRNTRQHPQGRGSRPGRGTRCRGRSHPRRHTVTYWPSTWTDPRCRRQHRNQGDKDIDRHRPRRG